MVPTSDEQHPHFPSSAGVLPDVADGADQHGRVSAAQVHRDKVFQARLPRLSLHHVHTNNDLRKNYTTPSVFVLFCFFVFNRQIVKLTMGSLTAVESFGQSRFKTRGRREHSPNVILSARANWAASPLHLKSRKIRVPYFSDYKIHLNSFYLINNQQCALSSGVPSVFILTVLTDLKLILCGTRCIKICQNVSLRLVRYKAAPLVGLWERYGYCSREPGGATPTVLQRHVMACV